MLSPGAESTWRSSRKEGAAVGGGFPRNSVGKESVCNAGDPGSIPGLGRSPGEGHGNPLQYSCLENPVNRGAWQATVHGDIQSRRSWSPRGSEQGYHRGNLELLSSIMRSPTFSPPSAHKLWENLCSFLESSTTSHIYDKLHK